ncbi:MAG: RNP-1 like protein RNA-binding protein [uncultured bacterium]|nr:MAG: RNP-1 like protein RNA-binding protein [uncultured bacterium]HBH18457.1 RNA-binding protein [Cyanobacteria bacterium UBA9579]
MKLFIGNLNFKTSEEDLMELLKEYGEVKSLQIIKDRDTGRSKGFGFVEMATKEQAESVMENLNGAEFDGKVLKVDYAKEKEESGRGGRPDFKRRQY